MKTRKSWREKLTDNADLPRMVEVKGKLRALWGNGPMLIPAPSEVDALMKRVPKGKLVTITELRAALAAKHKAGFACPMTTGIFSWIAAHAAEEASAAGAKRVTPYWRTLKTGGELNPKYPGGAEGIAKRLRAEGHRIVRRGKRMLVADFEKVLFTRLARA